MINILLKTVMSKLYLFSNSTYAFALVIPGSYHGRYYDTWQIHNIQSEATFKAISREPKIQNIDIDNLIFSLLLAPPAPAAALMQ